MAPSYGAIDATSLNGNGISSKSKADVNDHHLVHLSQESDYHQRITCKRRVEERYDPTDWLHTILAVGSQSYASPAFITVTVLGSALVVLSALPALEVPSDVRSCRAWCSRLALGSQAHSYVGIVLFLIMAFRNNTAVSNYQSGNRAFYSFKTSIRTFINALLSRVPRDVIPAHIRARAVGLAIAFPYAVKLDMREETVFNPGSLDGVLCPQDLSAIENAPTLPEHVLEKLTELVETEITPHVSVPVSNMMHNALAGLIPSYTECERIKQNPCVLSYISHLRALLLAYLLSLPLALVEQMGWSTIPVVIVVTYSLMSLDMLAVDIENPFGDGKSDLPLDELCLLIKEQVVESWQRWSDGPIPTIEEPNLYTQADDPSPQVSKISLE